MRRDTNSRAGPVVDNKLAANQLFRNRPRVFVGDGYGAAAFFRIAWARYVEARFFSEVDQIARLPDASLDFR